LAQPARSRLQKPPVALTGACCNMINELILRSLGGFNQLGMRRIEACRMRS
jgi:hypothetical protein